MKNGISFIIIGKNDAYQITTGGLFLITKKLCNSVAGMQNKFKKSQDLDLGLRLSKKGHKMLRKKEVLAKHHTISYNRNDRLWSDVKKGNFLYSKPLLYRDNIFNKFIYKYLAREVTMFFLVIILFLSIYRNNPFYLGFYLFVVLIKLFYKRKKVSGNFWSLYARYVIFDIGTILGLFLFWPKSKIDLDYVQLNE